MIDWIRRSRRPIYKKRHCQSDNFRRSDRLPKWLRAWTVEWWSKWWKAGPILRTCGKKRKD